MKGIKTDKAMTPVSSAGIMRFFDVGGGGPKIKPEVIVAGTVAFMLLVIIVKAFS